MKRLVSLTADGGGKGLAGVDASPSVDVVGPLGGWGVSTGGSGSETAVSVGLEESLDLLVGKVPVLGEEESNGSGDMGSGHAGSGDGVVGGVGGRPGGSDI